MSVIVSYTVEVGGTHGWLGNPGMKKCCEGSGKIVFKLDAEWWGSFLGEESWRWGCQAEIKAKGQVVWSSSVVAGKLHGWQREPGKYKESKFGKCLKSKQRATCTWGFQTVHMWHRPVLICSTSLSHQGRCSCAFENSTHRLVLPTGSRRRIGCRTSRNQHLYASLWYEMCCLQFLYTFL